MGPSGRGDEKMTDVARKIMNRIRRHGRGWVFTSKDFLDLASRDKVTVALHSLMKSGQIRRCARGLYDYPRPHPELGQLSPAQDKIIDALERATGATIWPTGAAAANALGLTTQVPAHPWFVTTGKPKTIRLTNKYVIKLQKATLPNTLTRRLAYMALQALDNLGPRIVDQDMIDSVAKMLAPADKKDIHVNLRYIRNPWLANIARQLTT